MRKPRLTLLAAVLGTVLLGTASHAQPYLQQPLPPNTVLGRLGGGQAGSAQAIPFATLLAQLNGLTTVVSGPATTTVGDIVLWNSTVGTVVKDSGIAATGTGTLAMGSGNTLTLSASPTLAGPGTLNVATGKTLTDTSGTGAVLLLGATGGGFAAYAGASCTNGAVTSIATAGTVSCLANRAATNRTIASPSAPNSSAAFKMQGLAGTITPTVSGNVLITISGTIIDGADTTVNHGVQYQISYGTGTAPTSNAALTGTQVGTIQTFTTMVAPTSSTAVNEPFSLPVVVTGLTVGTVYWIDLAAEGISSTSYGFSAVNIAASEI